MAPDVFVAFEVEKKTRDIYRLWEELYAQVLQVKEHFLDDLEHRYLSTPLQGYRLINGAYVQISPVGNRISNTVLGIGLGLYNPQTKDWLLPWKERAEQAEALRAELQQRGIQADQ